MKKVMVVVVEEKEGGMLAEEEGMLMAGVVMECSDEAFSEIQVVSICDGESINTELLALILVNPALAAVETAVVDECSRARFPRLRG